MDIKDAINQAAETADETIRNASPAQMVAVFYAATEEDPAILEATRTALKNNTLTIPGNAWQSIVAGVLANIVVKTILADHLQTPDVIGSIREVFALTDEEISRIRETRQTAPRQPSLPGFPDIPVLSPVYGNHGSKNYIEHSKVAMNICKMHPAAAGARFIISTKKKGQPEVYATVNLTNTAEGLPATVKPFDLLVENAVGNLMREGYETLTPQIIYREMCGLTEYRYASPAMLSRITESVERLRSTTVTITHNQDISFTDVNEKGEYVQKTGRLSISDQIIPAMLIQVEENGRRRAAWKVHTTPILHKYATVHLQQYVKVPKAMLSAGKKSLTERVLLIRRFIIQHIGLYPNRDASFTLDTILEAIQDEAAQGKTQTARNAKADRRKEIKATLEAWKTGGYIFGYAVKGNVFTITPNKAKKGDLFAPPEPPENPGK
jgi:hypothetical protein